MVYTYSRLVCVFVLLFGVVPLNGLGVPGSRKMLNVDSKETETRFELGSQVKVEHTGPKLAGWKEQCQGGHSMLNISCQQGLVCVQIFPYHRISELHSFVGVCANLSDSGSPLATCSFNEKYRGGGCSNGYRCLPRAHLYKQYAIPRTDSVGYCWPSNSTRGGKCRYGGRVEPVVCPKKLICAIGKLPEFPDSPFEGKCVKKGKNSKASHTSSAKSPSTTPSSLSSSPSPPLSPPPSPPTSSSSSSLTTLSTFESSPSTPITENNVSPPPPPPSATIPETSPSYSTQNSNGLPQTSTFSAPSSDFTLSPSLDDFHAGSPSDYDFGSPSPSDSSFTPGATSVDMSDGLYIPPVAKGGNCLTTGKFFACQEGLECQMSPNQPEVGQKWGVCIEKP